MVFCQLKFSICVRCDMAFIEPMHRNKPNITYLLTPWCILDSTILHTVLFSHRDHFLTIPHMLGGTTLHICCNKCLPGNLGHWCLQYTLFHKLHMENLEQLWHSDSGKMTWWWHFPCFISDKYDSLMLGRWHRCAHIMTCWGHFPWIASDLWKSIGCYLLWIYDYIIIFSWLMLVCCFQFNQCTHFC